MLRRIVLAAALLLGIGVVAWTPAQAEEADTQIAALAGEWKITYNHDVVREYTIQTDGKVVCTELNLKGQIKRKDVKLMLEFDDDDKLERVTLGTDGRLFVEHYNPKGDFPDKKAAHFGIGLRQK